MDIFLWLVAAITQAVVALLGIMAIKSDFAQQHFKKITAIFVVLTLCGMGASLASSVRASKFSDMVAQLTQEILFEVKGSPDGYATIGPNFTKSQGGDYERGVATFQIYNETKYPLIDTTLGITGVAGIEYPDYQAKLGDILPGRGGTLRGLKVQFRKDVDNMIEFAIQSRSVTLWETLYMTWDGKGWVTDFSLFKEVDGKEVYIRKIRDDFPYIRKRKTAHREEES